MLLPDWAGYLRYRSAIEAACDTSLFPMEWLERQIRNGIYKLWVGDAACIIVGIKTYPSGVRDVEGIVAAGDAQEIVSSLIPQAEAWGVQHGCTGALIESRPGWAKVLKPHGYEPFQTAIRKVL